MLLFRTRLPPLFVACALLALPAGLHAQGWGISEQKVTAFDMAAGDIFGAAVAIDGDLALVCNEWDDPNGTNSGSIYAYSWNGSSWQYDQKFSPSDGQLGDNFGRSVCMQGNLAVVGTHWDDDNGSKSGSAYVLQHDGLQWVEQQKLLASDGQANDAFGATVSIDGIWLAVGAWQEDQKGSNAGATYMYRLVGSSWVQAQKIVAPDGAGGDNFGRYVSVSGDCVLIGAWMEDQGGADAGAAYVFRYKGSEWVFEQKLVAFDAAPVDRYGWVTALQGDVAVVGAYEDDDLGNKSGSVYVYRHDGNSWVFEQKLLASDGTAGDWFGYSLALSGDRLTVSSIVAFAGVGPGHGYVFRYNGNQWVERQKLTPSDGADQDKFGFQIALSGSVVLSGAWRDDDAGPDTGSAYFFHCESVQPPPSPFGAIRRFAKDLGFGSGLPPGGASGQLGDPPSPAASHCW